MPIRHATTHRPHPARPIARTLGLVGLLGLATLAFAQRDAGSWTRLLLAEDALAACAGIGQHAAARGVTVQPGAAIGGTAAPAYWNPIAGVSAAILGANPDYLGCWFDAKVEVRTFPHACTFTATATLRAGEQRLGTTATRAVPTGETVRLTFRTHIPHLAITPADAPVYVDVHLAPIGGGCGG